MWDLIVSVPDHCLSFYFKDVKYLNVSNSNGGDLDEMYRLVSFRYFAVYRFFFPSQSSINLLRHSSKSSQ